MKREHERRIELVTGIDPTKKSHVLLYGANIGEHSAPLNFAGAATAMFPHRYPASDHAISLGLHNSAVSDRDEQFWITERENLERQFARRVRDRIADDEIGHLSVFSLAPQPLLIHLGTLLGDIVPCDVYQLHREPQTWAWPSEAQTPGYIDQRTAIEDRKGSAGSVAERDHRFEKGHFCPWRGREHLDHHGRDAAQRSDEEPGTARRPEGYYCGACSTRSSLRMASLRFFTSFLPPLSLPVLKSAGCACRRRTCPGNSTIR